MALFRKIRKYIRLLIQFIHISYEQIKGIWTVSELHKPIVSIFGGSRLKRDNIYAGMAHILGKNLLENGISVITGGGPGIMEAANCGAVHNATTGRKAKTIGITVEGLDKNEEINPCLDQVIVSDYFWARKWLLINYSHAYVFFPGGFGTLDELAEVLTLMQTNKLPKAPVIVMGTKYWADIINWAQNSALANQLILQEHFDFIKLTDDVNEVLDILLIDFKRRQLLKV